MTKSARSEVFVIGSDQSGMRVDVALASLVPELSRRDVQKLCAAGKVRRRGSALGKGELLREGDAISVSMDAQAGAAADASPELRVRYESHNWVIVSKPPNQPTAPRSSNERGALANALVGTYPEMQGIGHRPLEPGLLHRLDNGTSGLLVAARNPEAFRIGTSALKAGQWQKTYLAVVNGADLPTSGLILGTLRADRRHPARVALPQGVKLEPHQAGEGPSCFERTPVTPMTRFVVQRRCATATYLEIAVGAAFRHQIRAHFAGMGWPLVNDVLYGAPRDPRLLAGRHALHAARVAWGGTETLEGFDATEPLPDDLLDLLDGGVDEIKAGP